MKEVLFNEKSYNCPENWQEITVGMQIKVEGVEQLLEEAPIIVIIHGYTGIPIEELKLQRVQEVREILEILEFIYIPYVPSPTNKFIFNGKLYSCNADILDQNFEDWVSIQTILYNYKQNPIDGLTRLIATLCKSDGESLNSFNLSDRAKEFEGLSLTIAKDVEGFFLYSLRAYSVITQLSSTEKQLEGQLLSKLKELKDIMSKRKVESGIFSGMRFRIGIYQLQLKWVEKQLLKYFNSTHTNILRKS
jgi:hypothetical protein